LPNALRCAAAEVIDERGLGAVSLREVARRAGVSHTAPAHHFGDVRGLLTSLAIEGFEQLYLANDAARASLDDPVERLTAIGVAYVDLARSHPAHCAVMFRPDLIDSGDAELQAAGMAAYGVLEDTLKAIIDGEGLSVDPDDAVLLCWSAMQGLVVLEPKFEVIGRIRSNATPATNQLIGRFTDLIVAGMRNR
jgi:AcrR family transcriptional regulator